MISAYTTGMIAAALVAVLAQWATRGFLSSAVLIAVFCGPFLSTPGLSDSLYLPVERNSPMLGGVLAFIAAWVIIKFAGHSWQLTLALGLVGVMFWNSFAIMGIVGKDTHAFGLEVIFYLSLLGTILHRFAGIYDFMPEPDEVREVIGTWRLGKHQ